MRSHYPRPVPTEARISRHRESIIERLPLVYIETTIPEGQTVAEYRKGRRVSSPAMVR